MDKRIDKLFAPWAPDDSPGCVVAVKRDGETIHQRAYGAADLELGVQITPSTVFHIASLSKQITGFLVLLMADERTLGLDDDIRDHVPEVPPLGSRITLRHLLHHTSGLRDHFTLMKLSGVRPMDEKSERDILELLEDQRDLNFPPGEDFNYCNTGWVLLAVAVSRVMGVPFGDYVQERIFEPLGMTASSVRHDHGALIPKRASAYDDSGETLEYWVPRFEFVGPTGVYTTAGDLLCWADNIIRPRVGAKIVRRFMRPGRLNDGRSVRYGAGVEVDAYRGLKVVKHRGWDLGYTAHLAIYPNERFTVAIVGNVSTLPTEELGRRIADICLARRFPERPPKLPKLSETVLERKTGLYRHPRTKRAQWITLVDGTLHFTPEPSAAGLPLQPLSPTRFRSETAMMEFFFEGNTLTIREGAGVDQRYTRVARPWRPDVDALEEFAGTYHSAELDEDLTFRVVDEELVCRRRRWPERPVVPAYRDAFNDDIATYRFVRNRAGTVAAVVLSLDRIYHLRYKRRRR